MKRTASQGKHFYGWVMVACGTVILGFTHGIVTNCFSLFIIPVSTSLGVTRETFSACNMVTVLLYAVISFLYGSIIKKIRPVTGMKIASILLPAGYFCYSFCRSMVPFLLCSVVVGTAAAMITFLPLAIVVGNWFNEKRGQALGLCFMGSGLGGMLVNLLASFCISGLGWAATYRILGGLMAVICIPLIWFVLKETPEEAGQQPLGRAVEEKHEALFGPTRGEAVRMSSFWVLVAIALINGLICAALNNTIATQLDNVGYSSTYAGMIVALYMGGLAVGKIALGTVYDKVGAHKGTVLSAIALALGFAGLLLGRYQAVHPLIVLGAFGTASANISFPVLSRYAFGTRESNTIFGWLLGCTYITSSVSTMISNAIYTATGSYNLFLYVCVALVVLTVALVPLIRPCSEEA